MGWRLLTASGLIGYCQKQQIFLVLPYLFWSGSGNILKRYRSLQKLLKRFHKNASGSCYSLGSHTDFNYRRRNEGMVYFCWPREIKEGIPKITCHCNKQKSTWLVQVKENFFGTNAVSVQICAYVNVALESLISIAVVINLFISNVVVRLIWMKLN